MSTDPSTEQEGGSVEPALTKEEPKYQQIARTVGFRVTRPTRTVDVSSPLRRIFVRLGLAKPRTREQSWGEWANDTNTAWKRLPPTT